MKIRALLGLLVGLTITTPVWAVTVTPTGTILTVDYEEPATNTNGSLLTDLKETAVFYAFPGQAVTLCVTTTASRPTGGGHVSVACTVPVSEGQELDVTVTATASDLSGNRSAPSDPVVTRIDRLAPGKIQ